MIIESHETNPKATTGLKTRSENKYKKESIKEKHTGATSRVECDSAIEERLNLIETTLTSLQGTKRKAENDISKFKNWKTNFETDQNDMKIKIDHLNKKQKQNSKNVRKQINEHDKKVEELNEEVKSLKEKESDSNKLKQKLVNDIKEYENKLHIINTEIQEYKNKLDSLKKEIEKHSDLVSVVQEEGKTDLIKTRNKLDEFLMKQSVMCKLLHQKLVPIDKLQQMFNQNIASKGGNLLKLRGIENDLAMLTNDVYTIETRLCKTYTCHAMLTNPTPVITGLIISTFEAVREHNDQHFDKTTGKFKAPYDGSYLVCVTLHELKNVQIVVGVCVEHEPYQVVEVKSSNTSAAGSVVVDLVQGQELYLLVAHADAGAELTSGSSFTVIGL